MNRGINSKSLFDFVYIFAVIVPTVCGQLVLKCQVATVGTFAQSFPERALFLLHLVLNSLDNRRSVHRLPGVSLLDGGTDEVRTELCLSFYEPGFPPRLPFERPALPRDVTMPKMFGILLIMTGIIIAGRGRDSVLTSIIKIS